MSFLRFRGLTLAILIVLFLFILIPPNETSAVEDGPTIDFGIVPWVESLALGDLITHVLETRLEVTVSQVNPSIGKALEAVANGELDIFLEIWLPKTHEKYWEVFSDKVKDFGALCDGAGLCWAVPDYISENQVSSVYDLGKTEVKKKMGGEIIGIEPGAGITQLSERMIEEYDSLSDYELLELSIAAMLSVLEYAIEDEEWITVTIWQPHSAFGKYDIRCLEEPKNILGGTENIHMVGRKDFESIYPPKITSFLERISISMEKVNELVAMYSEIGEGAGAKFAEKHPGLINSWLGEPVNPVTNLDTDESFETIQAAIDDSDTEAGHTIKVDSAMYDSSKEPGGHSWDDGAGQALILIDKALTIRSRGGPEATVIDGRGSMVTVGIKADNVTFSGFSVTGAEISPDQNYSAGIDVDSGFANAVISNNIITGNQYLGIDIYNADGCTITDNVFKNMEIQPNRKYIDAIVISKAANTEISNNTIHHIGDPNTDKIGAMGIWFNQVTDSVIENNEIYSIGDNAILLTNKSSNNRIVGNTVQNTYFRGLLLFGESDDNKVNNNEFTESRHFGIGIEKGSSENNIRDNKVHDNKLAGIVLFGASNNTLDRNMIARNGDFGIKIIPEWNQDRTEIIQPAKGNEVTNNTIKDISPVTSDWKGHGIRLREASYNKVNNNSITQTSEGLTVWEADNNSLKGNVIENNQKWGIKVDGSSKNLIENNKVRSNGNSGILVTALKNDKGNIEVSSEQNDILNNTVSKNQNRGIELRVNNESKIQGNELTNNKKPGIELIGSSGNVIENNTVDNNSEIGIFIHPRWDEDRENILHNSNNNDIFVNEVTNTSRIDWNWAGHGIHITHGPKNNLVESNTVGNNYKGIGLWEVSDSVIKNNEVFNNELLGISVSKDSHNNLVKNNISHDNGYTGIQLHTNVDGNNVVGNEVYNTGIAEGENYYGVGILSTTFDKWKGKDPLNENNVFKDNYVHDNAFGIEATNAKNSLIKNNKIENNKSAKFKFRSTLSSNKNTIWYLRTKLTDGGGIHVAGGKNQIINNKVTGNGFGIEIQGGNIPIAAKNNIVKNNVVKNNTGGNVTLLLERWEKTTNSSGLNKQREESVRAANLSPQATKPQAWETTRTIEVANPGSFGLLLANASSTKVEDNTFINNGDMGLGFYGFSAPEFDLRGESSGNEFNINRIFEHKKGIYVGSYSPNNSFRGNEIEKNTTGVKTKEASGNAFHQNSIEANKEYGAKNTDDQTLDATKNWWGDPSGPYHPEKNPEGKGDRVSDKIKFEPWKKNSTETYPIPYVVSRWNPEEGKLNPNDDPTIEMPEILNAIAWWSSDTPVPNTGGKVIDMVTILELISYWADGKEITESTIVTSIKETKTQASTTTNYLKGLSHELSTSELPATEPLILNLSFSPKEEIAGLGLDLNLPEGWSLVKDEDGQPTYKPSTDQILWLNLKEGEKKELTYQLLTPSDVDSTTEYELEGKLVSKSPNLNRQLPTKVVTLTPPPELSLQETAVSPNPVTTNQNPTFRAQGKGIVSTRLQVYNTSGNKLYQTSYRKGSAITWNLTDSEGNELTNGIYLYRIKARGVDGTVQTSKVQRLLVLR